MVLKLASKYLFGFLLCTLALTVPAAAVVEESLPDDDAIMKALVDELERSMGLQMEDLEKPYFIQFSMEDSIGYQITARYGAIVSSDRDRSRDFSSKVRVGSYELDNTNFTGDQGGFFMSMGGGGGGGRASIPLENDYTAIRQAIWWATDWDYKDAVENLTKKRAYMKDKNLTDRPQDFTKAPVETHMAPTAKLVFDKAAWEDRLKKISGRFKDYPQVQESMVRFSAGAGNNYLVNSEGTRIRTDDYGTIMIITAEVQAEDGMKLSSGLTLYGTRPDDLPSTEEILKKVDGLVDELTQAINAPILESYTGPVLFDGAASCQMFREMLSTAVAGRLDPVGTQRAGLDVAGSLEKKLGQRILPDTFTIYDDPTVEKVEDTALFGNYLYDSEGVKAQRVDLVKEGVLENMVMSRVPTKKLVGSNGHGREGMGSGDANPSIGTLFIKDQEGLGSEAMKEALIEAAKEEGLDYGLRVASIRTASFSSSQSDMISFIFGAAQRGGGPRLGDPVLVYKVYVEDGREEMVRGCEFGQVKIRDLKHILAAGEKPTVYNYVGIGMGGATPPSTIVAPAVLFEEMELSKIEQEHPKLPLLSAPGAR